MVAGVFVRVYNEQPTFAVSDPPSFCKGLVSYLHVQTQSPLFRAPQADAQPEGPEAGADYHPSSHGRSAATVHMVSMGVESVTLRTLCVKVWRTISPLEYRGCMPAAQQHGDSQDWALELQSQ